MSKIDTLVNQHEHPGFLKNAMTLRGSVTPLVINKVLVVILYSALISYLYQLIPWLSLPVGPFEYAGLIMGLILVFRINAGYDRWWEARKIWGNIVNQTRNLAIIVLNYNIFIDEHSKLQIINYISAMPYLIKNHLNGDNSLEEVRHLLDDSLLSLLTESSNKPNVLSSKLAQQLGLFKSNNDLAPFAFLQAEEKRSLLLDSQGACERIRNTPMPFVMAIKARRFIFLFLLALPFALVNVSVYINPIISGLVAYALLSLDQIGVELQNPFSEQRLSHLPLNDICRTIENNIKELPQISGS
ncbi:MAG: bestrophin family ion channel [Legionella sp.]|jgi:putative membrane protein